MPQAVWNGIVVAQSDNTVLVEGNHYFPRESLVEKHFTTSAHTSVCGWKGTASYLTVVVGGEENPDAAWYYPETKPEADSIRGHVAFWKGVEIR